MTSAATSPSTLAKRLLPQGAKDVVESGIRAATTASAGLRQGPDFLVVGTKRGGTTFTWSTLVTHPQVMTTVPAAKNIKSPHYFYRYTDRGPDWYLGHFPTRAARRRHAARHGAAVAFEASPFYLFDPRVAERARALLPAARIVMLLRDPVVRARSHHQERTRAGVETLPFAEALAAEPERLAGEQERMLTEPGYYSRPWDWFSYRTRGEYAPQVKRWFDAYGRDRVLVLRSEDLYADPDDTLGRIQEFVGIDRVGLAGAKRNRGRPEDPMDPALEEGLRAHYAPHNQALADLLGEPTWW
ncbi:sulfotransferase domain-containing protein [uncultured Nocardioides sp.]|uniref:sulfotransferase domain-containing protein n=1 Tax=uncultured Nocardioides sp. TaxID=198441 RepID=UPI0026296CD3|nr:sulfotransferase domain-containing protein [uncultured Nocardioides sp.]